MHVFRSSKQFFVLLLSSVFTLFFSLTIQPTPIEAAPPNFVTTCGPLFCLNGQTFNVAGTNNHYLGWGTQAEVDAVLNDAKAMNLNVVRTILHSVRGSLDSTQMNQGSVPLKWNWGSTADSSNMGMKGVYLMYWDTANNRMAWNDSTTDGLGRMDYVIARAGQLGIRLNIALLDFWQWAGGVQQINANFKGGNYDVHNAPDRYTFFFSDARTRQFYKDWVNHVLNRTNSITGVQYKDDPTIFAWDLMNEPEISGTTLGQAWISEMSAYVKSIDPNHMVASGNEGFTDGHAGSNPQLEMGIATLDFATWHTYPTYHGLNPDGVVNLINAHCQTAASGGKPVLLQEFAYPSNRADQASVYQLWVDTMHNNPNCAGWLFWRLEGMQENGQYPPDNGEGFGVFNNGSPTSQVFKNAAQRFVSRGGGAAPSATPPPTLTFTPVPPTVTPTLIPPTATSTITPIPPTATFTTTPVPPTDLPTTTPLPPTDVVPTDAPTEVVPSPTADVPPVDSAVQVEVSPASANPGEAVAVSLHLNQVSDLYGLEVMCQVDPAVLVGGGHTGASGFNDGNSFFVDTGFNPADGTWRVAASRLRPNPAISGSETAFTLNYVAQAAGESPVHCAVLAVNTRGEAVPVTVVNGSYSGINLPPSPIPTDSQPMTTPAAEEVAPTAEPTAALPTAEPGGMSLISGAVNYPGGADHSGITVALLAADGTPLVQVVTNANGAYRFTDVPLGAYLLEFSAANALTARQHVLVERDGSTLDLGTSSLPMGDTDGSGLIDLNDASLIGANFGLNIPPGPTQADVNADGLINIVDLTLMGANYNLTAPVMMN